MKIYPLLVGYFESNEAISFKGGNPNQKVWYASYIFYIDHPEKKIVVDTGFAKPQFCLKELNRNCKREIGMSVEERLKELNIKPSNIDTVILTHCHWDHIGGLNLFANAQVYCQEEEVSLAIAPPNWQSSAYPRALSDRLPSVKERLKILHGEVVLERGIIVRKVGAHSPGSQMVFVKSASKQVVITGDAILFYANLEKNIPIGFYNNLEEAVRVIDYINSRTKEGELIVLPGHDPQVWEKYKGGLNI